MAAGKSTGLSEPAETKGAWFATVISRVTEWAPNEFATVSLTVNVPDRSTTKEVVAAFGFAMETALPDGIEAKFHEYEFANRLKLPSSVTVCPFDAVGGAVITAQARPGPALAPMLLK